MSRPAGIDYKKPYYINSFNADEIIFNMIRGTIIPSGRYEGSLSVSLDSLKIRELCGTKPYSTEFPRAFWSAGVRTHKKFCDAVINVQFSESLNFYDAEVIEDDLKNGIDAGNLMDGVMPLAGLGRVYLDLLEEFKKNRDYLERKTGTRKTKTERITIHPGGLVINGGSLAIDGADISVGDTAIRVRIRLTNISDEDAASPVRLYIGRSDETGECEVLGIYETDEIAAGPGETRKIKADLDIRDIMIPENDHYALHKGMYRLFIGDADVWMNAAALNLPEDLEQTVKHDNPGWLDAVDRDVTRIACSSEDAPAVLTFDAGIQKTVKACGRMYREILNTGCDLLINTKPEYRSLSDMDLGRPTISGILKSRAILYTNGFDIENGDGIVRHYVAYKRSAGKAKTGGCLFIWDRLYEDMKNWTWMGHYFEKNITDRIYDLTSIKAYEALTLSNIENRFRLLPKNILLINDAEGATVEGNRRMVCKETLTTPSGESHDSLVIKTLSECSACANAGCREAALGHRNRLWDGQALLDESVFKEVYGDEKHGMMLLRNHFFKACAFNAKISEYYRSNGIEVVYDMFGKRHTAADIKLIITPDSLKYLKFADESGEKAYKVWTENLTKSYFGVVRTDKPSSKNGYHKVGYQILNTLPLSGEDMKVLFEHQKEYLLSLWEDDDLFRQIIPESSAKGRFISGMYDLMSDPDALLTEDFLSTDDYISYKRQLISDIRRRMRKGAIELKGDMYILCSMPYEMLKYSGLRPSVRKKGGIEPLLGPDEAYIEGFSPGRDITLCRYPHLSAGSVCSLKSSNVREYSEWFNLKNTEDSSGIVVVSPYASNIMVKLGGADFDSDTALFIYEPLVQEAAAKLRDRSGIMEKLCDEFAPGPDGLPVSQAGEALKGEAEMYGLSAVDRAFLDWGISKSQSSIGTISNDVQLFNSYLWEGLRDIRKDSGYCRKIYECLLKLSVLNELEIDRSKHSVKLNVKAVHKDILNSTYDGKPILEERKLKKKTRSMSKKGQETVKSYSAYYNPAFLYEIKKERGNTNIYMRSDKYWDCPPDHLSKLAASIRKPRTRVDKKKLGFMYDEIPGTVSYDQAGEIKTIIKDAVIALEKLDSRRHITGEETDERMKIHNDLIEKLAAKKNIRTKTLALIVRDTMCMKNEEQDKYYDPFMYFNRYRILGLLFMLEEELDRKAAGRGGSINPMREVLQKMKVYDALSDEN